MPNRTVLRDGPAAPNMNRLLILSVLLLTLLVGNLAVSADYQKGSDAALQKDFVTALKEWKPLAERGDATPQFQLGWLYHEGLGVTQDYKTAIRWYTRAAEQEHAKAQANLGFIHANGKGVLQNYVLAHMWSNIAASNGNKTAGENIKIFEEKMSASQIQRAQKLAIECVEKNYKGC